MRRRNFGGFRGQIEKFNARMGFLFCIMLGFIAFSAVATVTGDAGWGGLATVMTVIPVAVKKVSVEADTVFELKTAEEVEGMNAEELAGYYNAFNEHKRNEIKKLIEGKASVDDIQDLKAELMAGMNAQAKELNTMLKEIGLSITKLNKKQKSEMANTKSVRENLEEYKDALREMKESTKSDAKYHSIDFKVATVMLGSTNVSGGNVPVEQRIAGLDVIPTRRVRLMDLISSGVATSNIISWVSQANKDGSAGGTTEGATKNQIDFDLVVDSEALQKRTAFIKVSTEMLDDIDFIATEINNELMRELMLDIESQVYEGDDGTNNLNGIRTTASAFAAGVFALAVDLANDVDVLVVAADQIMVAEQEPANAILMHPSDVTALKLVKLSAI